MKARKTWVWTTVIAAVWCGTRFQPASAAGAAAPNYEIAFSSLGPINADVFIADEDGNHAKPLLPHAGFDGNGSFSRDGRWVVFTSERDGSYDIYRAHPDASGLERLVDHPAYDDQAALSPDGRSLAFVSTRTGQADIWVLDLTTKQLRNLTNHPAGDFRPGVVARWTVAGIHLRSGFAEADARRLTNEPGNDAHCAWSPDGEWITFSSARGGFKDEAALHPGNAQPYGDIYVMRADGTDVRQLTDTPFEEGTVAWAPVASGQKAQADSKPVQRISVVTDYIYPEGDLRQWANASDLVVVGTIADSRVDVTPRDSKLPPMVTTTYEVVIDDAVRATETETGTRRDGRVLVRVPGGRIDIGDKILDVVTPSMPRLEKGQQYVLLLMRNDSAAAKTASVPIYGPLAGGETVFAVTPDQHVKTPGQGRLARAFEGKTVAELLNELRGSAR